MNGVGRVRGAPSLPSSAPLFLRSEQLMKFSGPTLLLAFFIPVGP